MTAQITALGLSINRRGTTNILKVTVRDDASSPTVGPTSGADVLLDGKLFFRASSAARARDVSDVLNKALDRPIQLYELSRKGASVYVKGQPVLTVQDGEGNPESVADAALKTLRTAVYRYVLEGVY